MKKLKETLAILMLITLASFAIFNLVAPEPGVFDKAIVTTVPVKLIEKEAAQIDEGYQRTIGILLRENDSLESIVKYTKASLVLSKQKAMALQEKVGELAEKVKTESDTAGKIVYCDSLQKKVVNLIESSMERDSLCDRTINGLSDLLENKDSTINLCQQSYTEIKGLLDISLSQQRNLSDELNASNKKLRRKTVQNRLLSASLLVLSGITTTLVLQNR